MCEICAYFLLTNFFTMNQFWTTLHIFSYNTIRFVTCMVIALLCVFRDNYETIKDKRHMEQDRINHIQVWP